MQDVIEATAVWFERELSSSAGTVARDYLDKRGLKPETVRQFRIGYAPDEKNSLYQHLLKSGFAQSLQAEAGLIITPEQGSPFDRFRGRVMFPYQKCPRRGDRFRRPPARQHVRLRQARQIFKLARDAAV